MNNDTGVNQYSLGDIVENPLLVAVRSDKRMLDYVQNTHVTQIREHIFNVVDGLTTTLSPKQKVDIWSKLIGS